MSDNYIFMEGENLSNDKYRATLSKFIVKVYFSRYFFYPSQSHIHLACPNSHISLFRYVLPPFKGLNRPPPSPLKAVFNQWAAE